MCKCNKGCGCQPSPCQCNYKKSCVKDISTNDVVYDATVEIPCFGIQPGTPLTEALQTIGDAVCDIKTEIVGGSTVLLNIGGAEEIYAGDTLAGAKQLKTLIGSDSINTSSDSDSITFTVDEDWLDAKIESQTDQTIVFFSTANPNSGSPVFTPNQPQDGDVVYTSSVDNSLWVWNGSAYVTYIPPSSTPFVLAGTSLDAGGNKTTAISRTGSIGINVATPQQALHVVGSIRQTGATSSLLKANASGDIIPAVAGTDYLTPTGSAAGLTSFPTFNQNTTGNAATVTTNANLSGDVTSIGNVTTLSNSGVTAGSYTNANLTVDSKGRITSVANGGGNIVIADFYTDSQNTGSSISGLFNIEVPGGTMNNNGDKLIVHYSGTLNSPGINKTIEFRFGTSGFSQTYTSNGSFKVEALVIRTSNTSARVSVQHFGGNQISTYDATWTAGVDFTTNIGAKLNATATSTGDVVGRMATGYMVPAAI